MSSVSVSCPQCSASLKLPDRRMLGRTAKCPKCAHRFQLTEDLVEVPLQLVDNAPPAPGPPAPLVGTSARWVPDPPQTPAPPAIPEFQRDSPAPQKALPETPAATTPGTGNAVGFVGDLPFVPAVETEAGASVASSLRHRRRRKNPSVILLMGTGVAVVAGAVIGTIVLMNREQPQVATKPPVRENPEWEAEQQVLAKSNADSAALSPTSGEPIPLTHIPFTPHLICHLHPAALWERERSLAELQANLGILGIWLRDSIRELTRFEPEEIEELTVVVNFGPRGSAPDVAAVIRLREAMPERDQMARVGGRLRADLNADVYENDPFSFLIVDRRTIVVAPVTVSDRLADSKDHDVPAPVDLQSLLRESDRDRHITMMFDLRGVDTHREDAFRTELHPLIEELVLWFGRDTETVSWSAHFEPDLFMETLLHQTNESSPLKLQRDISLQLQRLPETLVKMTRRMQPATVGRVRMIGRFPAMMKALETATSVDVASQYVRLITILPRKAAPNLAAAAMLTWDQSVMTDFNATPQVATTGSGTRVPDKIADRLRTLVDIDFRATPLQEAFDYMGDQSGIQFIVDGDGLKNAAFTQNMPQTMNLGEVPVLKAIDTIFEPTLKERDPMVLIVDENAGTATVTTKSKATASGLTIYNTKQ